MKPPLLIIEDDPDGARSVSEAASDAGFDVTLAANGRDGLERFREHTPDVVLTDLVLPDIDGIEVLDRMQRLDREVPVIVMTAYGSVDSSVKAMRTGAYDYITKPLDLDDLQSKLRRASSWCLGLPAQAMPILFPVLLSINDFSAGTVVSIDPR